MTIEFLEIGDSFVGTGRGGRRWRIFPTRTGWRMEFCDPGDLTATNAGFFGSVKAAQAAAGR